MVCICESKFANKRNKDWRHRLYMCVERSSKLDVIHTKIQRSHKPFCGYTDTYLNKLTC